MILSRFTSLRIAAKTCIILLGALVLLAVTLVACNTGFIGTSSIDYAAPLRGKIDQARSLAGLAPVNWDAGEVYDISQNYNRVIYALGEYHVSATPVETLQDQATAKIDQLLADDVNTEAGALMWEASIAARENLDPHTRLMDQEAFASFTKFGRGSFTGIGVRVRDHKKGLLVIEIIPESQLTRDQIKRGDLVLAVNGVSIAGLSLGEKVDLVRGPPNTTVDLDLELTNDTLVTRTFTRRKIETNALAWRLEEFKGKTFAVITLYQFADDLGDELEDVLEQLEGKTLAAVVIDLRNNPGGLLDEAVHIIDLFEDDGVAVTVTSRENSYSKHISRATAIPESLPLYFLVNGGSASASEVVAGGLQLSKRAIVLGSPSYGKTTVQYIVHLRGGYGLAVTSASYYPGDLAKDKETNPAAAFDKVTPDIVGEDDPETDSDELIEMAFEQVG